MEIPRGNYIPAFHFRSVQTEAKEEPATLVSVPAPPVAVPAPQQSSGPSRRILAERIVSGLIIVALAASCLYFWNRYRSLDRSLNAYRDQPSVSAFWGDVLGASPDTDIVLADAILRDASGHQQTILYVRRLSKPQVYQPASVSGFKPGNAFCAKPNRHLESGKPGRIQVGTAFHDTGPAR